MEATQLAQQFNDARLDLERRGHRVVVRRARAFLEAGELDAAVDFLARARASMGSDRVVSGLAEALRVFQSEGGDAARLVTAPAWVEGQAQERRFSRLVESNLEGGGVGALVAALARQQTALAEGEPLAAPPARLVEPSALPPLPRSPAAAALAELELDDAQAAPIANIFAGRRGRGAVEVTDGLEEKPLVLDETDAPTNPVPAVVATLSAIDTGEPIELPEIESDVHELTPIALEPASLVRAKAAPTTRPMEMPELHAPPELEIAAPPAAKSPIGFFILLGVLVLVIAGGVFFALKG
jgi:cell division septation protein DedD